MAPRLSQSQVIRVRQANPSYDPPEPSELTLDLNWQEEVSNEVLGLALLEEDSGILPLIKS